MEQLKKINPALFVKRDLARPPAVMLKNVERADAEVPPKLVEYLKRRNKQSSQKHGTKKSGILFFNLWLYHAPRRMGSLFSYRKCIHSP